MSTAIALPLTVLIAVALAHGTGSPTAPPTDSASPVNVVAPPADPSTVEPCAQILSGLPVQLDGLNPRIDQAPQSVAWGDPPVVLRCGVPRPAALMPDSTAQVIAVDGVNWLAQPSSGQTVFTVIDRSLYLDVSVPTKDQQPLATISDVITKVAELPAVCYVGTLPPAPSTLPLCTRRPG
ncbi:MAG TPA: DUF3515 domain-containing protein [Jatrophihabitantaceae bacterium]|nr:DUF3515 domain-containing protein [Jatrophihabitantaceae bacterium]